MIMKSINSTKFNKCIRNEGDADGLFRFVGSPLPGNERGDEETPGNQMGGGCAPSNLTALGGLGEDGCVVGKQHVYPRGRAEARQVNQQKSLGETQETGLSLPLVVDANIFLAAIIRESITRSLLFDPRFNLFAPQFLFSEVEAHVVDDAELRRKTGLDCFQLRALFHRLSSCVRVVSAEQYSAKLREALVLASHDADAPYLAAAMSLNCALWSNGADMKKQKKVVVFTTAELVRLLC